MQIRFLFFAANRTDSLAMGVAQWVPCVQVTFGVTIASLVVLFCCRGWSTIRFTCHLFGRVLVVETVMSVSLETTTV